MNSLDHLYTEQKNSFIVHYSNVDMFSTIITNEKEEENVCGISLELCNSLDEQFYWCQVLSSKFNICLSISLKRERGNTKIHQGEEDFCMTIIRAAKTDPGIGLCWEGKTQTYVLAVEREKEGKQRERYGGKSVMHKYWYRRFGSPIRGKSCRDIHANSGKL